MTETERLLNLDHLLHDRLFEQRTIVLSGPLADENTLRLCSALLVLAADDATADIRLLINSPGGSVPGMLAIRDCMRTIPNDVATINLGMAYSAGQFLLSSGAKGKRYALPYSRIMVHQPWGGAQGQATDVEIHAREILRLRELLNEILAGNTGQELTKIQQDTERDYFMSSAQAKEYGIIDQLMSRQEAAKK